MASCECKPRMNHRLLIEQATETQNAYGEPVKTWATFKAAWGNIMPVNGREAYVANSIEGRITHKVEMRYDSLVTPKMRLKYGTRVLNIVPPLNIDEASRYMTVSCEEVV